MNKKFDTCNACQCHLDFGSTDLYFQVGRSVLFFFSALGFLSKTFRLFELSPLFDGSAYSGECVAIS
jgi:hypothetical protein